MKKFCSARKEGLQTWMENMSMPKTSRYKRTSDKINFNFEDAVEAIKAVKLEKKSVRASAKQYNVPRSTLARYMDIVLSEYEDISFAKIANQNNVCRKIFASKSVYLIKKKG